MATSCKTNSNADTPDPNPAFKRTLGLARAWKAHIRTIVAALILRQARLSERLADIAR
jgi:hypothetical protein